MCPGQSGFLSLLAVYCPNRMVMGCNVDLYGYCLLYFKYGRIRTPAAGLLSRSSNRNNLYISTFYINDNLHSW